MKNLKKNQNATNSKTQTVKKSNCDKSQVLTQLKLGRKSNFDKNLNVTKSNCEENKLRKKLSVTKIKL